jgi:hypothetical protein
MIGTMLRPDHARESGNELCTALRTLTEQYSIHRYFLHAASLFKVLIGSLCDVRHIKKPRVNRAKLQQAAAKLLSKDDARRIAVNIAKL